MPSEVFKSGPFAGVDVNDAFAKAASRESPIVVDIGPVNWPDNLGPAIQPFGKHQPGQTITTALTEKPDVLILLYTDLETSALLDVFTHDRHWTPARKKTWYPYGHNFDRYKDKIKGMKNDALNEGIFGYLFAMKIGNKSVVLYKTELHPKTNGTDLPFVTVINQLVGELSPKLVLSTGTAGAIGSHLNCGDVAITSAARLHCKLHYPAFPRLNTLSEQNTELKNSMDFNTKYVKHAAANFTKLSLPGLAKCHSEIANRPGYAFVKKNTEAPAIYATALKAVPGPQPMDIVSADYLTVDDSTNAEGLQSSGVMNDTDDAFAFYAISELPAAKQPKWFSVRNASEPQIRSEPFPSGTSPTKIVDSLKATAGPIYGIYQYCTTLNSAFACWGIIAGMN